MTKPASCLERCERANVAVATRKERRSSGVAKRHPVSPVCWGASAALTRRSGGSPRKPGGERTIDRTARRTVQLARRVLLDGTQGGVDLPSGLEATHVGCSVHRRHDRVLRDLFGVHHRLREALTMETTLVSLISGALVVYLFWSLLRPESF